MICHRAIQHEELREALTADTSLPGDFIDKLYSDSTPAKVLEVSLEPISVPTEISDVTSERERILQEVRKRELHISLEAGEQLRNKKQKTVDP